MKKSANNLTFQYVWVACLTIVLLFSQSFALHLHVVYDNASTAISVEKELGVHAAFFSHDQEHHEHVQEHKLPDVKASPDNTVKKVKSFSSYVLFFLFVSFFLGIPKLLFFSRKYSRKKLSSLYYLFNPPLRAPPIYSVI